jgi:hypothetical protein
MSIFPTKILPATDGSREAELAATACCDEVDPCSILESWMLTPKTSERRSSKPSKGAP